MTNKVHRNGDSRACGASTTVTGQSTVYVNNKLVAVQNDPNSHGGGGLNASINPGTIFVENIEMVVNGSSAAQMLFALLLQDLIVVLQQLLEVMTHLLFSVINIINNEVTNGCF
jgi:hypothetical protein